MFAHRTCEGHQQYPELLPVNRSPNAPNCSRPEKPNLPNLFSSRILVSQQKIMRFTFYLFMLCLLASSCKSTQKATSSSTQQETSVADGSSAEKAIKVKSIGEEYEWAKAHCLGCQFSGQALLFVNKKPYDALTFKLPDGSEKKFYFDISSFFGKF